MADRLRARDPSALRLRAVRRGKGQKRGLFTIGCLYACICARAGEYMYMCARTGFCSLYAFAPAWTLKLWRLDL